MRIDPLETTKISFDPLVVVVITVPSLEWGYGLKCFELSL